MLQVAQKLDNLKVKIQKIVEKFSEVSENNNQLIKENASLKTEVSELNAIIKSLNNENRRKLNNKNNFKSKVHIKELDKYISQVDEVIEWLEKV